MVPSKSASAATSISLVAMSRWLVGSSSTRKFGGSNSILAITRRAFSPPDSTRHGFSISSPEKPKQPAKRAQRALPRLRKRCVQRFEHCFFAVQQIHRMLREIAHLDADAQCHRALVRRCPRSGPPYPPPASAAWICPHHWRRGRTSVPCAAARNRSPHRSNGCHSPYGRS